MNDLDCLAVDLFGAEVFYNNRVLLTIDLKLSPFERPKGLLYIFNRIKNDCIEGRSARGHSFEAKWFSSTINLLSLTNRVFRWC